MQGANLGILIIDANAVARRGLVALIAATIPEASVTSADTLDQWRSTSPATNPDLIVLTTGMPEAIQDAAATAPLAQIIVLGLSGDPLYRDQALAAGARHYLPREQAPENLPGLMVRGAVEIAAKERNRTGRRSLTADTAKRQSRPITATGPRKDQR